MRMQVRGRARGADSGALLAGVGLGITVALQVGATSAEDLQGLSGQVTVASRFAAMIGTYLVLVGLMLVARVPWIERSMGHDRSVQAHKNIGRYSLVLISAHVLLVTMGYAAVDRVNGWTELWRLITTYEWMLPAAAGFVLMIMAGVTSYHKARARMKYETWWVIHIYTYLAIALAFMHQIQTGQMFVNQPLTRIWWVGLYVVVAASLVTWRFGRPIAMWIRHRFVIDRVVIEAPSVVSIYIRGRKLEELGAEGGNFFGWRFLTRDYWWQSHPYSLSAPPTSNLLRITVKDLGDQSGALTSLKPGTKVIAEGPYGVFTASTRKKANVVLIGGGIGITPIRALLEELPEHVECDLLYRAATPDQIVFKDELDQLAKAKGARIHYLVGSPDEFPMNARTLRELVPAVADSDIYICGPHSLVTAVRSAASELGVAEDHIHDEAFAF